jgi:hypothetical protein
MWHQWKRGELHIVLVGKLEEKRPLGRLRFRWENNIKVYLEEDRLWGMYCIDPAQVRASWWALVNMVI